MLFLDEFDAIAKLRGDTQELGELKRVVNSFIQNLDTLGEQTIVLAATNHDELLDSAVWRRFAYRLQLSYPSTDTRRRLWEEFLPTAPARKKDLQALVDLSEGFSGADINEVCLRLRRKQITEKTDATLNDAFEALRNLAIGEGESRRPLASAQRASAEADCRRSSCSERAVLQCRTPGSPAGCVQGYSTPLGHKQDGDEWLIRATASMGRACPSR